MNKIFEGMMTNDVVELIAEAYKLLDKETLKKVHGMAEIELLNRDYCEEEK